MRIQHNIMAMGAYRNYTSNVNAMKKNLEKLSSGYKINRAGDDAAGLAISEKMRAQITGLETAQKNAKDGISLVQTAEGALTEVHDMLNRMVTLATQSANGTYDNETDRVQLQKELNQLRSEIDRIADSSNFNGIKLLDGSRAAQSTSALGSAAAQLISGLDGTAPTKAGAAEITVNMKDGSAAAAETLKGTSTDGTNVIAGTMGTYEIKVGGQTSVKSAEFQLQKTSLTIGGKSYDIDRVKADGTEITSAADQAAAWAEKYNADTANTDYTATANAGVITLEAKATGAKGDSGASANITFTDGTDADFTEGTATTKATIVYKAAITPSTTRSTEFQTVTVDDIADVDLTVWAQGDKLTVTDGNDKAHTYEYSGAAANNDVAALNTSMGTDGLSFTVVGGKNVLGVAQTTITGLKTDAAGATSATITAGTTKASEIAEMFLDTSDVKIGHYFNIEVYGSNGQKKTGDPTINNGDTIKLVAKYGGALNGTDIDTDISGLTISSDGFTDATLKGSVSLTDGTDEGKAAVQKEVSRYTMTFDLANLHAGQSIKIDDKTFTFVNKATTPTPADKVEIDLSKISDTGANGDISKLIQDAITGTGGLEIGTGKDWKVNADLTKTENGKFTLVLETADDKVGADDTNLGEGRVTVGIPADSTRPPIDVFYERAGYVEDPATQASGDPFATATYKHDALKNLDVGDKIYIGDAEIEIVDGNATNLTAKQIKKTDLAGTDAAEKLAKIIEQQKPEFGQGKVTFDLTAGTITITGTEVGQTGAALKKQIGDVKFLDKSANTSAASTATSSNEKMNIVAGDTTVSDLLGADLQGITGNKLGDIFDITVNGNAKEDEYIIQEGDVVKFTAKPDAQLDEKVMENFKYTGDITSLTVANGYDEGSNASGNKTRYNLTIDMAKVAGGNSFTFGNVNGKSVTFDLSYDAKGTGNNTVGANDKDDIADSDGTRVVINLYGKTTAQAQEEIYNQVAKAMGGDFTVSRATSGNKITLNLEANKEGIDYNFGNIRYSSASGAFSDAVYNPAGGAAGGVEGTHAKAIYKFDASQLQVGDVLSIGDAKINFVDGETGTTSVGGKLQFNVNLADAKANPNGALTQMLESAGFKAGQIRFDLDNKTLSIEGRETGQTSADLQAAIGSIGLTSSTNRAMETGGLKLQIGDTADTFNQLTVDIQDMHAEALGLDAISIADQNNAAKAIDVIKAAINTVSDVRGTLGATQNRLDHTINNLSVMTENIQDAESTIRDTDVAAEMMEYTKNNILIQSAQAMLAQANQVPQGVLQLLQ